MAAACANGCKGSCTTGCGDGCAGKCGGDCSSNTATSANSAPGCGSCGGQCGGTCWSQCSGSCGGSGDGVLSLDRNGHTCWCGADCSGCGGCSTGCTGCTGDCAGCSGSCGGSCSGTCANGCSYTCKGSCRGYCKGTCSDGCQGNCKTACSGECQHLCNVTCISDVAADAYEHLIKIKNVTNLDYTFEQHPRDKKNSEGSIILDWLDAEDMRHLFGIIQEEGRRRVLKKTGKYTREDAEHPKTIAQTLTRDEEKQIGIRNESGKIIEIKSGDFADDEKHIKKLLNMYADNTGKSISLSVGGTTIAEGNTIKKSIGRTLIEKALDCYDDVIPVNTTSEESGRQTKEEK